jgi:N-acetylglutamate synthase-like GNAT family acetyltransferase
LITIDFSIMSNEKIVDYLLAHYDQLDAGDPVPYLKEMTLDGIADGSLAIEKRTEAFAIIERANRSSTKHFGLCLKVNPEANLMFLFVMPSARKHGVGSELLQEIQQQYMEDQAMTVLCAGDSRKAFFERAGFRQNNKNHEGLYYMVCSAIK